MSYLENEISRLVMIVNILTDKLAKSEQESARLEAWATMLFTKLSAIKRNE